jgi:hypothetical protein
MRVKRLGDVGAVGLQQRRGGRYFHFLGHIADLQGHVETRDGVDLHGDGVGDSLLKSSRLDGHLVLSGNQLAFGVVAGLVGKDVEVVPFWTSVMVTLAPLTAAPEGSVTAPTMVPKTCWALRVPLKQNSAKELHTANEASFRRLSIFLPLGVVEKFRTLESKTNLCLVPTLVHPWHINANG